jgi:hypothetical protein
MKFVVFLILVSLVSFLVSLWFYRKGKRSKRHNFGSCNRCFSVYTAGVFNLWIELLSEDSTRREERYPRYENSGVNREDMNTLNHEMDHFNTWKAFYSFIKTADVYHNRKFSDCKELAEKINDRYKKYHAKASKHSLLFDDKARNQGGQYAKYPFDTSTFKWE